MNGRDFLPAARRMAASSEEADRRSAASRAYYAAFHATRDQLAALRFRTPRADRAHNYLVVQADVHAASPRSNKRPSTCTTCAPFATSPTMTSA